MTYFDKFVKGNEFQIFDFIQVLTMICFRFFCKEIKEVEGKNHNTIVQIIMNQ